MTRLPVPAAEDERHIMRSERSAATPLLIFPANGNGLESLDCVGDAYRLLAFVDDSRDKQSGGFGAFPVWSRAAFNEHRNVQVLAVPGSPTSYTSRRELIRRLELGPERYARVIHTRAVVSPLATLGYNVVAMAGVVITSNARIGDHICLLPNTVIHHDAAIASFTLIGANVCVAGNVEIGENCYIGSGSSIKNGVRIGARALIGLGSTVIRDVPADAVVAGNPARLIRQRRSSDG